jgi:hypothetical protein
MNTDNLDKLWNSGTPAGPTADEALELIKKERGKDTRRKIRMGFFGFNLTLATAVVIWATASGKSRLAESWPATVSLLALWATYIEFIRYRMSESRRYELLGRDLKSALRLTLDKTLAASREMKVLLAVNLLTIIPMSVASVQNLLHPGKMTPQNAVSFAVVCAVVFGANIVFLGVHYFARLWPQCKLLQNRIGSLEA